MTIREYLQQHEAPRCSRCGADTGEAREQTEAIICSRCTDYLCRTPQAPKPVERSCPDCGGALDARERFCPKCTRKRRRDSLRRAKQRQRMAAGDGR